MRCDNLASCHNSQIIGEDNNAVLIYCNECGEQQRIGKDLKGNPEHRLFSEWYKRDVVQPDHPLYYKYAGAKGLRII